MLTNFAFIHSLSSEIFHYANVLFCFEILNWNIIFIYRVIMGFTDLNELFYGNSKEMLSLAGAGVASR